MSRHRDCVPPTNGGYECPAPFDSEIAECDTAPCPGKKKDIGKTIFIYDLWKILNTLSIIFQSPYCLKSIASGIPGLLENALQHVERESDKTLEQNYWLSSLVDLAKDMPTILNHAITANALLVRNNIETGIHTFIWKYRIKYLYHFSILSNSN